MKRGRAGTVTHDYKRHGTTTLFAALNAVQAWLAKHPRFVMHFTPTSASWLNMVEQASAKAILAKVMRAKAALAAAVG